MPEKIPVRLGNTLLESPMTFKQALRHGQSAMPEKLRREGFTCRIFRSVPVIHGSDFFKINYLKPGLI